MRTTSNKLSKWSILCEQRPTPNFHLNLDLGHRFSTFRNYSFLDLKEQDKCVLKIDGMRELF